MRTLVLLFIFFIIFFENLSAENRIEFIKKLKLSDQIEFVDDMNKKSVSVENSSVLKSFEYADSAFIVGIKIKYEAGWKLALSRLITLSHLLFNQNVSNGLTQFGEFVTNYSNDSIVDCKIYNSIGKHYAFNGDYKTGAMLLIKSLKIAEEKHFESELPNIFYSLGWFYTLIGDYENASDNYIKSMDLFRNQKDSLQMIITMQYSIQSLIDCGLQQKADSLINELQNYRLMDLNPALKGYYYKIMGLSAIKKSNDLNLALRHLFYALEVLEPIQSRQFISDIQTIIAHIYGLKKDYETSLKFNYKALNQRKLLYSVNGLNSSKINIGIDYFLLKKYDSALVYLNDGARGAFQTKAFRYYVRALDWLHHTHAEIKNNDSALYYLNLHKVYYEKLNSTEITRNTVKFQLKYELERKESDLTDIKLNEEKNKNLYFIIIISLMILTLLTIIIRFRQKRNDNLKLIEQTNKLQIANEEIKINESKLKELNEELDFLVKERTDHLMNEIEMRKMAEDKLLQSQDNILNAYEKEKELNTLKSKFISMISHEFRTPLTVINTSNEIIKYHGDQKENDLIRQQTEKIKNSVELMVNLIDDVIKFNQNQNELNKKNYTLINLKEFINEIINEQKLTYKSNIPIELFTNGINFEVFSEKKILRHIFSNLIGNSIKYSLLNQIVIITLNLKSNLFEFIIKDQGIGISDEDLPKVLEPFYRGSNIDNINGTGFGLFLVNEYVKKLNGTILISSKLNFGTTITVVIPC